MLERPQTTIRAGAANAERGSRAAPTHRAILERRRGNRLVAAWKAARTNLVFPSVSELEAAADPELMRHSMLVRVGVKGALTIERFGPPAPQAAGTDQNGQPSAPVVTPLVVTWVLAVSAAALRRRAPVTESDEVKIGKRHLCYRCAVVPVSSDGAEVDALVGVLGYRWA